MCDVEYYIDRDLLFFFFQAEDGIRDLVRSRGLGDVYKRQLKMCPPCCLYQSGLFQIGLCPMNSVGKCCLLSAWQKFLSFCFAEFQICLLYTSDAADERSSVDLGGRRIIKKKKQNKKR